MVFSNNVMEFEKSYAKLNPEQKQAVDTIDGPLMVIAGPGSGKTQILSMRVANILRISDVSPSNILCLTFTDSATKNMQDRLSKIIGMDAYQVNISTFHGFCNSIISQYPEKFVSRFGIDSQAADDLSSYQIMQEVMAELPLNNPLSVKIPNQGWVFLKSVQNCISNLKKGGLTPESFESILKQNSLDLQYLQTLYDSCKVNLEIALRGTKNATIFAEAFGHFLEKITLNFSNEESSFNQPDEEIETISYPSFGTYFYKTLNQAWTQYQRKELELKQVKEVLKSFFKKDENKNTILIDKFLAEKHQTLVQLYRSYNAKMYQAKLFDFNDMILEVNAKIESDQELKYNLIEKYQYILVDEFQDTSGAQLRLIKSLCYGDSPNVMVVGDDDQSIYKFQGASTYNIINFRDTFAGEFVSLKTNYRSSAKIVDSTRYLAQNITDSISYLVPEIVKEIYAHSTPDKPSVSTISRYTFGSNLEENLWTAKKIRELIDTGISPKEIAVISPKHENLSAVTEALEKYKIPLNYERANNVLLEPKIQQLIIMMKFVASLNSKGVFVREDLLSQILAFDCFGISSVQLYDFATNIREHNWSHRILNFKSQQKDLESNQDSNQLNSSLESPTPTELDQAMSLQETELNLNSSNLDNYTKSSIQSSSKVTNQTQTSEYQIPEQIIELLEFFLDLAKKAQQDPGEKIIDYLIGVETLVSEDANSEAQDQTIDLQYFNTYKKEYFDKFWNSKSDNTVKLLSCLKTLIDQIRAYGSGKIVYLKDIVDMIEIYERESDLRIIDKSSFAIGLDSVSVLTSYKSKGLEFEHVFVVNCTQNVWHGKGHPQKLSLPQNLPLKPETDNPSDKLRNFYVALTRAKSHIYITLSQSPDGKVQNELVFLNQIPQQYFDSQNLLKDQNLQQEALIANQFRPGDCVLPNFSKNKVLAGLLQNYKMSVTHLNNFLDLENEITKGKLGPPGPIKFLENNLLRFPQTRSTSASYGTAIHAALHEFYTTAKNHKTKPDLEVLLKCYTSALDKEKILFKEKDGLVRQGTENLTTFWKLKTLEQSYQTELSFSQGVQIGQATLSGNIDKVIKNFESRTMLVVDYKTGKPIDQSDFKHKEKGQYQGHYGEFKYVKHYNQLVFYKLLVENSSNFKNRFWVNTGQLEFLNCYQPNQIKIVEIAITDQDAERMQKLIQAVWKRIMNLDFSCKDFSRDYRGTLDWIDWLVDHG